MQPTSHTSLSLLPDRIAFFSFMIAHRHSMLYTLYLAVVLAAKYLFCRSEMDYLYLCISPFIVCNISIVRYLNIPCIRLHSLITYLILTFSCLLFSIFSGRVPPSRRARRLQWTKTIFSPPPLWRIWTSTWTCSIRWGQDRRGRQTAALALHSCSHCYRSGIFKAPSSLLPVFISSLFLP
jgi:hypothetical protein